MTEEYGSAMVYESPEGMKAFLRKPACGCERPSTHPCFSTPAILLKRISLGDFDLLITFLSLEHGKLSVVAKNAKKSRKRFSGLLEPFTSLNLVCRRPARGGLSILQEAAMDRPFSGIRGDVEKTAYASYWAELVNGWLEEGKKQEHIFYLLYYCLRELSSSKISVRALSIIFQVRFLMLAGFAPDFAACMVCHCLLDGISGNHVYLDPARGGIVCGKCSTEKNQPGVSLAKGTVKQLKWIQENDIDAAIRVKFTPQSLKDGLYAMEAFVPYHLGREPRSLGFLRSIR
ncbi:MAG: DNA repair protein RecO [Deltaproteobacteria bacterium]|nr:DNA repair protein RecO [Deltaproteobacteria bacterium]